MENKDFIKWLASYAEGFKVKDSNNFELDTPEDNRFLSEEHGHFKTDRWHKIYYPLLLQRAIEGINRESDYFTIEQYCDYLEVTIDNKNPKIASYSQMFPEDIGWDKAKEEALKYIWEQKK